MYYPLKEGVSDFMLNWNALAPSKARGLAKTDCHAVHLSPQRFLEFTDAFSLCPTSFCSVLLLAHFTTALPASSSNLSPILPPSSVYCSKPQLF